MKTDKRKRARRKAPPVVRPLPCPFCGIVPKVRKGILGYSVECNNLECYQLGRRMGGRAWVVEQWNRRSNAAGQTPAANKETK